MFLKKFLSNPVRFVQKLSSLLHQLKGDSRLRWFNLDWMSWLRYYKLLWSMLTIQEIFINCWVSWRAGALCYRWGKNVVGSLVWKWRSINNFLLTSLLLNQQFPSKKWIPFRSLNISSIQLSLLPALFMFLLMPVKICSFSRTRRTHLKMMTTNWRKLKLALKAHCFATVKINNHVALQSMQPLPGGILNPIRQQC